MDALRAFVAAGGWLILPIGAAAIAGIISFVRREKRLPD